MQKMTFFFLSKVTLQCPHPSWVSVTCTLVHLWALCAHLGGAHAGSRTTKAPPKCPRPNGHGPQQAVAQAVWVAGRRCSDRDLLVFPEEGSLV